MGQYSMHAIFLALHSSYWFEMAATDAIAIQSKGEQLTSKGDHLLQSPRSNILWGACYFVTSQNMVNQLLYNMYMYCDLTNWKKNFQETSNFAVSTSTKCRYGDSVCYTLTLYSCGEFT